MGFERTDYLSWYIPRVRGDDGAINLHSSGVPPLDVDRFPPVSGAPWSLAPGFESALSQWLDIPGDSLVYCPGATGGTLLALLTLAEPGSSFVVEQPIYEPMLRQAERLGPVRRLVRRAEDRWSIDLAAAEELIGPDTAAVLLTEPHNPSGVFAPRNQVERVAELAARHGAVLLINEVYRGYADRPSYHGLADHVVVVSSLSKLCGAYAARLGWLSGAPDLVRRLHWAIANYSMPSGPSAGLGLAVMAHIDELEADARGRAALVDQVDAWVQATPGVGWVKPEGPGFGCVSLPAGIDDQSFVERLHRERQVLLVPGRLWESPGSVRLSWLQTRPEDLPVGLARLGEALAETTGAP